MKRPVNISRDYISTDFFYSYKISKERDFQLPLWCLLDIFKKILEKMEKI